MNEFDLIKTCFSDWPTRHSGVTQGIGDDCLVWQQLGPLVISTDTAVAGRHFPHSATAEQIAQRAFLPAISDLAAMAAKPAFFTLALSLPERLNNDWLLAFAKRLRELAAQYNIMLAGGDTTASEQLVISIAVHGTCDQPVLRSGALVGDDVWVSGQLGQAAAALPFVLGQRNDPAPQQWLDAYWQPQPQLQLAQQLAPYLNSCIDISDGLLGDAGHIAVASQVDLHIDTGALPIDTELAQLTEGLQLALTGGDDYQLCFTSKAQWRSQIEQLAGSVVTRIGCVKQGKGRIHWYDGEQPLSLPWQSFSHF